MWSLFKKNGDESVFSEFSGEKLAPLKFSNGKTQEDIVKEVLQEIAKGNKIILIKGVCGTGKCLDKDTRIFCKPRNNSMFGYHRIIDLIGTEGRILSLDEQGNFIESEFKNVRETGIKRLFKLKTRTGREIVASDNHPFLTITEKGVEWIPLGRLFSNSYVCLPNKINIKESESFLEDSKLKILGHLISEGKLGDKAGSPKYYQDKSITPQIRQDYIDSLKEVFPEGQIKDNHQTEVKMNFRNMDTRFGTTNKLRLFIRQFGLDGSRSKDKFVPDIIFNLSEEKISVFLQALFSGDGCIYCRKSRENEQIVVEYDTISKRLALDVSLLLARIGIQHTITTHKFRDNPEYSWRITVSSQSQIKKFIERIGFLGEKQLMALDILKKCKEHKFTNIDKVPRAVREYLKNKGFSYNNLNVILNFEEIRKLPLKMGYKDTVKNKTIKFQQVFRQGKIDFLRSHLTKINEFIKDSQLSFICNSQIYWDKIESVEFLKEDVAYDLEVPEHHNFIANGLVVHNSAIALNLARHFNKTSIVVPIKSLQEQYEQDYTRKNFILKKDKKKLTISVIKGRNNFPCKFIGEKADFQFLPCTIDIKDANMEQIKKFLNSKDFLSKYDFTSIKDVRRVALASCCPYWSPLLPADINSKPLEDATKTRYRTISGKEYALFQRAPGCKYYEQYKAYADADVLIFNSLKYLIETAIGRKPRTELDIIDECDEFLDNFAQEESISLPRLSFALSTLFPESSSQRDALREIIERVNELTFNYSQPEIEKLQNTDILELIELILDNPELAEADEDNYYNRVYEICSIFSHLLDETYVSFEKTVKDGRESGYLTLVTINLASRFKEISNSCSALVLMSGTLHSEHILKDIFGLEKFKIIEAETKLPGVITKIRTGLEKNCKYDNFKSGLVTREQYLKALEESVKKANPPVLIHVHSFDDLPTELEKIQYGLKKVISREKLKEIQQQKHIDSFKNKEIDLLFTTKCSRGVDFPGDICNSIILTKYPYPNIKSPFWQILKREYPEKFMEFYMDKSKRDLIQKIARGLRYKGDHIILLSPDVRVLNDTLK